MSALALPSKGKYHHGNLVEALIAAAIELIEEKGVDALAIREVAKRAGVSPGAPFRHFSGKTALLTAVAEQAMARLTASVQAELRASEGLSAIEGLRAIGRGYLLWALANPTHFQVVSSRSLIDFNGSPRLVAENEAIRFAMVELIARGCQDGSFRPDVVADDLLLMSRAFIYGLARMWIDGHFPEWKVRAAPHDAMKAALDLFIVGIDARGSLR